MIAEAKNIKLNKKQKSLIGKNFVKMKYQNQKTGIRYGKRFKKKRIQTYPTKLENNDLPNGQDRAEAFVYLFAENSLSSNFSPLIL